MRLIFNPRLWVHGLFWSWNAIFLAFFLLGFAPFILIGLIVAVREGTIPLAFLAYGSALVAIPIIAVIVALWRLRSAAWRLFALGYGVQGPLMLLLAVRLFGLRELTWPVWWILLATTLGLLTLLWQLLDFAAEQPRRWVVVARLIGLTLLLTVGLYASVWMAFYVPPTVMGIGEFVRDIVQNLSDSIRRGYFWQTASFVPFFVLGSVLLLYSATLFVLMPIAVPIIYMRQWLQASRIAARHTGALPVLVTALVTFAVLVGAVLLTLRQPQAEAFALLTKKNTTAADAAELLKQEELIRQGLLNAYLAPQRYIGAAGEVTHIREMYQWAFGLTPADAKPVQNLYEAVARPILYEPVLPLTTTNRSWENIAFRQDAQRAAELYVQFFDQPINRGEKATVVAAVRATWDTDQATRAWQAVDDREILLVRQEVNVAEHEDWAEFELYEVYENQTATRQEVVYYFNLPESAVITGVWLGNSAHRNERFVYRISPRGAAQSLYRNEVRQQRDPALVEQLGPRQYRLRVFPIEPRRWRWDSNGRTPSVEEAPQMHLWLTWRVMVAEQAWPLPQLAERRNVYWTEATVRLMNGKPFTSDEETWLPKTLPTNAPIVRSARRIDFTNGESVVSRPFIASEWPTAKWSSLAVVLDRSRSMAVHARAVEAALNRLRALEQAGVAIDVYLTSSPNRGEAPSVVKLAALTDAQRMYFGGQDPAELLTQFNQLQANKTYEAVLVLTDGSGYELGDGTREVRVPNAPVWMVHLDGALPLGYDDKTLAAIQASGGGVTTNLDEAFVRMSVAQNASKDGIADVSDGYVWLTVPTSKAQSVASASTKTVAVNDPYAAMAARRLILAQMQRQRGKINDNALLDQLHKLAREQSIVTPYSSMIVLVNEQQQKRLDELEKREDRFQREKEDVGETTPESLPVVTGVPEPEEWLLMGIGAALLGWYYLRGRRGNKLI